MQTEQWAYGDGPAPAEGDEPESDGFEWFYCLDWHRFADADWDRFWTAVKRTPHYVGVSDGCQYWFSIDEESDRFVCGWVEPPYFQVFGRLTDAEWQGWDGAFRKTTADFPWRTRQAA